MFNLSTLAQTYSFNASAHASSNLSSGTVTALIIAGIILYLVQGYILGKVFLKAGKPAWAAFVPFYNEWILLELGGKSGALIFLTLIPFVGSVLFLVFYVIAMVELAHRFGKSTTFAVFGLILFSLIGFIILGFGDAKYDDEGQSYKINDTPYPPIASNQPPTPPQSPIA